MNVVVIDREKFTGPAGWNEITPNQFRQFLRYQATFRDQLDGPRLPGKYALLQLWYGIRYRHLRLLDEEQRLALTSLLDFLDERPERWLLPSLRVGATWYVGPGNGLEYLTFGEFMYAESARAKQTDTQFEGDLAGLVAALYRPKALFWQSYVDGGRRPFDQRTLDGQTESMRRIDPAVQQGILMNYLGCLDQFPRLFKHLFKKTGSGSSDDNTWLDVGLSLARNTGALGTFAQLEQTNLYLVLTTLDAMMKENEELKAKTKTY